MEGYGEAHEPESHLIPLVLDVALGKSKGIKVFGRDYPTKDGSCVRDYIHVEDLVEAHLLAFDALEGKGPLIYNIGNGLGFTVLEVVEAVRRMTGMPVTVEECGRRVGDPAVLVASSALIQKELGWKPKYAELDLDHRQRVELASDEILGEICVVFLMRFGWFLLCTTWWRAW